MGNLFTTFTNCRLCIKGKIVEGQHFVVSQDDGLILESTGYIGGEIVDLDDAIIAPGFLELHTNGANGFHYTNLESDGHYQDQLQTVAEFYPSQGVTGFWATVPTVESNLYPKLLPNLRPRSFESAASLLGVHVEGPYLHPSKPGAHDASLFLDAAQSIKSVYGQIQNNGIIKLATIAPDVANSDTVIKSLVQKGIRVSMGHSSATYEQGLSAMNAGATCLTHVMNCMAPLHHRSPGLTGLVSLPGQSSPYYSLLCDGIHLHSSVASLLFRSNPERAILVSDSIELAGLSDGLYSGNGQIRKQQRKVGNKVTIEGTDTLIGSCTTVADCVKNIIKWTGCDVAQAVRTVTENVVDLMDVRDMGKLEAGRRADFVVLDDEGDVKETWIAGIKVWDK